MPTDFNTQIIEEFRANAGKVGGPFEDVDLLLLTTTGAKTGKERVSPLAYRRDGDAVAVFGSYAGRDQHPQWFHNVRANPEVTVEIGTEKYAAQARVAEGAERKRIWNEQKAAVPQFADYETRTTREIPVVVIERR